MRILSQWRERLASQPRFAPWLERRSRLLRTAVFSLIAHLLYAFYHGALGLRYGSLWFGANCGYYLLLAALRFGILLGRRETRGRVRTLSGALLLLLSPALGLLVALSLREPRTALYGTIPMITIATYTFANIGFAVRGAVKHRGETAPRFQCLQALRLAEVAVSLLTMQRSMLASFGDPTAAGSRQLNLFTGTAVCLFVAGLGLWLLQKNKLERKEYIMATSKFSKANQKIAETVSGAYKAVEEAVVGGYQKIEDGAVGAYQKVEDAFVGRFLTREGESVDEAKSRLKADGEQE